MAIQMTVHEGGQAATPRVESYNQSPGAQYQRRLKMAEETLEVYRRRFDEQAGQIQGVKEAFARIPTAARGEKGERGERGERGDTGPPGETEVLVAEYPAFRQGRWFAFWRKWLLGGE